MASYMVFMSGGVDSTALAIALLLEGHKVTGVYVNIGNNRDQAERERRALAAITKHPIFSGNFTFTEIASVSLNIPRTTGIVCNQPQTPIFLFVMSYHLKSDFDYFAISFVSGDHDEEIMVSMRASFRSLSWLNPGVTMPELVFPIASWTKNDVWRYLPKDIQELVTWCEAKFFLDRRWCGVCQSCVRMIEEGIIISERERLLDAWFALLGDGGPDDFAVWNKAWDRLLAEDKEYVSAQIGVRSWS